MNKVELIKEVASLVGFTQKDVKAVLDTAEDVTVAVLGNGDSVKTGLVTFSPKETKARVARNPKTGETVDVPAGAKVSVKQSKALKDAVK